MRIVAWIFFWCIFNFSDKDAAIAPELNGNVTMLLNTDWEQFGGQTAKSTKKTLVKNIPPFTGLLYTYPKANESELHFTALSGHDSVLDRQLYGANRPHFNY